MYLKYPGLLFIVLLLSDCIFAQMPSYGKYTITTQPLQFTCRDVPITVERIFKRNTLGATLAYRFDSDFERNPIIGESNGAEFEFISPRFKAFTFGVSSKYFISKRSRMYFEGQLFSRLWWHNTRFHEFPYKGSGDGWQHNTSARNKVVGFKLLWGTSFIPKRIRRVNPVFNWYVGVGIRMKYIYEYGESRRYTYYGHGIYEPYSDKHTEWAPSMQAGFNLGVEIFSKNRLVK